MLSHKTLLLLLLSVCVCDSQTTYRIRPHKAQHSTGGFDALAPSDIGAATSSHTHVEGDITDLLHQHPVYTIGTLPAASTMTNRVVIVSDSTSKTACTTGGGSVRVACVSDGSVWTPAAGAGSTVSASSSLDFPSIPAGVCSATLTFTLTGVATTNAISRQYPTGLSLGLIPVMWVSATDTISVSLCNFTGAAVDPAAGTYVASIGGGGGGGGGSGDVTSVAQCTTGACFASLTIPDVSDTLVGRATTDDLTNKTIIQGTLTRPVYTSYTVATLPSPTTNMVVIVTNGNGAGDCTVGGGSTRVLCSYTGSAWAAIGDGNTGGGGTPGGSSGQAQFNNAGAFQGRTCGTGLDCSGTNFQLDSSTSPTYLTGTQSFDFGTVNTGLCANFTFTLSGAASGDSVMVGVPTSLPDGWSAEARVSATNTIKVQVCNHTGSNADPGTSATYRATIVRSY